MEQRGAVPVVRLHAQRRVGRVGVRMAQQLLAQLVRVGELGAHVMIGQQAAQHRIDVRTPGQLGAQRPGAGEVAHRLGGRVAARGHVQGGPHDHELELALAASGLLGALRQRVERRAAVGDRFARRVPIERRGRGHPVIGERPRSLAPAGEVHGELRGAGAGVLAVGRLLARADGAVQANAPHLGDALVEHVPVERMLESVEPD